MMKLLQHEICELGPDNFSYSDYYHFELVFSTTDLSYTLQFTENIIYCTATPANHIQDNCQLHPIKSIYFITYFQLFRPWHAS